MNRLIILVLLFTFPSRAQWTVHQLPTNNRYTGIFFADSLNGWISGHDGIFRTTNGGDTWALQRSGLSSHLAGLNARECWATGVRDTLLHTTNAGNDWTPVWLGGALDSISRLGRICFVDSLHGWVIASRRVNQTGWILRTTDGGATWSAFPDSMDADESGPYPVL